jgi:hypothetical protein
MKTYTFYVHETTVSKVDIHADSENAARAQFESFSRGEEDAPDLTMYDFDSTSGYELSDLHSIHDESGKKE